MHQIMIARAYEDLNEFEGKKILVDRLWPRGKKKEDLKLDLWEKDIAPSTKLRKAFNHNEEDFPEFKAQYLVELKENPETDKFLATLTEYLKTEDVMLVYGAKSTEFNNAIVLKQWLEQKLGKKYT